MTPRMKKVLKEMKKLTAYELATMETQTPGVTNSVLAFITCLEPLAELIKDGTMYGLTPNELDMAMDKTATAVRMYRERTGVNLSDAIRAVEEATGRKAMHDAAELDL